MGVMAKCNICGGLLLPNGYGHMPGCPVVVPVPAPQGQGPAKLSQSAPKRLSDITDNAMPPQETMILLAEKFEEEAAQLTASAEAMREQLNETLRLADKYAAMAKRYREIGKGITDANSTG